MSTTITPSAQLKEKADAIVQKRGELSAIFEKNSDGNGGFKSIGADTQTEIIHRNDELATMQAEYDALKSVDEVYQRNAAATKAASQPNRTFDFNNSAHPKGGPEEPGTSLGEQFVSSRVYQDRQGVQDGFSSEAVKHSPLSLDIKTGSVKTLFATSAGYAPFVPRDNTLIYSAQRRPIVADLIPQTDTAVPGVRYMEETLFTNLAAAVAESGVKPESALQFTERLVGMTKIATTLPVTDEQLADVPQIRDIIDNRLRLMLMLEEERELLQGSGTSPEMLGFLNKPGVQTAPKGAQDDFSAVLKAIVQVENTIGFANVSGIVLNPLDWLAMRTKQDSTGRFIMGNPDSVGPAVLWGKPCVPTIAEPQGTILLGDFQTFSQILRREGVTFRVGYVNNQLLLNQITIVVEMREVLVIYRPSAFCLVTGTF